MIQRLLNLGLKELFGGLRYGQPFVAALGTATTIIVWMYKRRPPSKELLTSFELKPGESAKIRFMRDDLVLDEAEVEP
jgi:hypothetical protein